MEAIIDKLKNFNYSVSKKCIGYKNKKAEGTSISLNDSVGCKMSSFKLDGRSIQETRSGKNLLPFANQDFTVKGVRFYAIDGDLYLDGTSTGDISSNSEEYKNNFSFTLPAGTYHFERGTGASTPTDSQIATYIRKYDDNETLITNAGTFTLTEKTKLYIGFYSFMNQIFNNRKMNAQLEQGDTATEYETCGASPSPDYPSEIEVIEDNVEVNVVGKNLANLTRPTFTSSGVTFTNNGDGTYTLNGTCTNGTDNNLLVNDNIKIHKNKFYKLSIKVLGGTKNNIIALSNIRLVVGETKTWNWLNSDAPAKSSLEDGYIDYVNYFINKGAVFNDYRIGIQLEMVDNENSLATEFVPYQENAIELILPEPICSLPNGVKDEIYIKDGKAYLKKNVGRVDLGTLVWAYKSDYGFSSTITGAKGPVNNNTKANAMCDIYTVYTANNCYGLTGSISSGISITMSGTGVIVRETNYTDVETFTNAMSGYYFYYELTEPYEIDLGAVTMLKTYKNVSNIFNSKDTNMNIEYCSNEIVDVEKYSIEVKEI